MTMRESLAYQRLSDFLIIAIPIQHPFLRKIKYENALSRLHSLNASNNQLCCIVNVENAIFVSNCENIKTIFASINAIISIKQVDFYVNICYSILSTFEEG